MGTLDPIVCSHIFAPRWTAPRPPAESTEADRESRRGRSVAITFSNEGGPSRNPQPYVSQRLRHLSSHY